VSFLLEVYGQLEEPDGIAGLLRLRRGGLSTADALLAAERAGQWSEAQSMYEQLLAAARPANSTANSTATCYTAALTGSVAPAAATAAAAGVVTAAMDVGTGGGGGRSDPDVSALQQGALRGLLHMGHLQAVLHQVCLGGGWCVHGYLRRHN
jgi:hypothetical protein